MNRTINVLITNCEHYHTPYQVVNLLHLQHNDLSITYYNCVRKKRISKLFGDKKNVHCLYFVFFPLTALAKFFPKIGKKIKYFQLKKYDKLISRIARPYSFDIVHAYNGSGLFTFLKSNPNALKIIECGIHPSFYKEICNEEYTKYGISQKVLDDDYVNKSIQEFDAADFILTQTEICKRSFLNNGIPEGKIKCIPLGVDLKGFNKSVERDGEFRVLFVGRVTVLKGVQYLIEACEEMISDGYNIKCDIVGPIVDDYMTSLKEKYEKYEWIHFFGKIDSDRLKDYYSRSSVTVIPSIVDSFCMAVYESLACQTPVIISENVGAPIEDAGNGFIVPIRDAEAIKEKIKCFYSDRSLVEKFGEKGFEMVKKFTWQRYANELADFYNYILNAKKDKQ